MPQNGLKILFCLDKHVQTENFFGYISTFMWNTYEIINCKTMNMYCVFVQHAVLKRKNKTVIVVITEGST